MDTSDYTIISVGLLHLSMCAPAGATPEQIMSAANALHPTGLESEGWSISDEPFAGGQPNPTNCERGASRRHHLLNC